MRPWLLRLLAVALLLGLLPAVHSERAAACDCDLPTVSDAFEYSAAVFSGRLVSVEGEFSFTLTFEVFRVWKGSVGETQVAKTSSLGGGDCGGYPFRELGQDYLVYAGPGGEELDELWIWLCNGTGKLEYSQMDLEILGEGWGPGEEPAAPEPEVVDEPEGSPPSPGATGTGMVPEGCERQAPAFALLAAGALALAGVSFSAIRRRARQT